MVDEEARASSAKGKCEQVMVRCSYGCIKEGKERRGLRRYIWKEKDGKKEEVEGKSMYETTVIRGGREKENINI